MPVGKDSKLAEIIIALRAYLPTLGMRLKEWWSTCRAEPILFWHTPAVRFSVYGIGTLVALKLLLITVNAFVPQNGNAQPRAETADFHVVCSDPACGEHFVIRERFKFDDFPVKCRKCGKETAVRAMRCFSTTCRGAWVAPKIVDGTKRCPHCGAILGPED